MRSLVGLRDWSFLVTVDNLAEWTSRKGAFKRDLYPYSAIDTYWLSPRVVKSIVSSIDGSI